MIGRDRVGGAIALKEQPCTNLNPGDNDDDNNINDEILVLLLLY